MHEGRRWQEHHSAPSSRSLAPRWRNGAPVRFAWRLGDTRSSDGGRFRHVEPADVGCGPTRAGEKSDPGLGLVCALRVHGDRKELSIHPRRRAPIGIPVAVRISTCASVPTRPRLATSRSMMSWSGRMTIPSRCFYRSEARRIDNGGRARKADALPLRARDVAVGATVVYRQGTLRSVENRLGRLGAPVGGVVVDATCSFQKKVHTKERCFCACVRTLVSSAWT